MNKLPNVADSNMLRELEYVDASVFESKDKAEREVCNFILALALLYNDLKDLLWAFIELKAHTPEKFEISPRIGHINGVREHVTRYLYALHHELLVLIQKNPEPQKHPLFMSVIGKLDKDAKGYWAALIAAAAGEPLSNPLSMMLTRVRGDLAFHYYGLKTLARGFDKKYDGSGPVGRLLLVSRGTSAQATRFHFADGAAQGAMEYLAAGKTKEEIGDPLGELTKATLHSVSTIVFRFMEDRGKGWTKYRA